MENRTHHVYVLYFTKCAVHKVKLFRGQVFVKWRVVLFCLTQHFSMARVIGLRVNRKVQSTVEPMPNLFVGLYLIVFWRGGGEKNTF